MQYQHQNTSEHPLPMGVQLFGIGFFPLGIKLFPQSRIPASEFVSIDRFTSWPQDEAFSIYDNRPALGYFVPGQRTVARSRFYDGDAAEQYLFDFLATEDGRPIVTEDTNEGLGLG